MVLQYEGFRENTFVNWLIFIWFYHNVLCQNAALNKVNDSDLKAGLNTTFFQINDSFLLHVNRRCPGLTSVSYRVVWARRHRQTDGRTVTRCAVCDLAPPLLCIGNHRVTPPRPALLLYIRPPTYGRSTQDQLHLSSHNAAWDDQLHLSSHNGRGAFVVNISALPRQTCTDIMPISLHKIESTRVTHANLPCQFHV